MSRKRIAWSLFFLLAPVPARSAECDSRAQHPEWIFCDDFEATSALVGPGRYFEQDDNKGEFQPVAGAGWKGSRGMRALWQTGEVEAGNLKLGFGRSPSAYLSKGIRDKEDFREVYYRMYVRSQAGWTGDPFKLSRATVMAKADWSQAMIAHLWGDEAERLKLDPAGCVDAAGQVTCAGYNDFSHLKWIGSKSGVTMPFTGENAGKWLCVETHVRLNDPGQANGLHEFWIEDKLEARRENLDFVGQYQAYGINAVFFENHWNTGSPKVQERYFDNIVVSTARVTCAEAGASTSPILVPPRGARERFPTLRRTGGAPWIDAPGGPRGLDGRLSPGKRQLSRSTASGKAADANLWRREPPTP